MTRCGSAACSSTYCAYAAGAIQAPDPGCLAGYAPPATVAPRAPTRKEGTVSVREPIVQPFSGIALEGPTEWLWRPRIPRKGVTLLAGNPGKGKSFLAVLLAAELSRGTLPGAFTGQPSSTLVVNVEDGVQVVKARLLAAHADQKLVAPLMIRDEELDSPPEFPRDAQIVEEAVAASGATLLVLDPINAYIGASIDSHKDADVRRVLGRLALLAERTGCAVLAVMHLTKGPETDYLRRLLGSVGYSGTARSVLLFDQHPDDPEQRALVHAKANWGKLAPALGYRLEEIVVFPEAGHPDDRIVPKLELLGEVELTQHDLLRGGDEGKLAQAVALLEAELADGPSPTAEIEALADARDISRRTLMRARAKLEVVSERVSVEGAARGEGRWILRLPIKGANVPEANENASRGTLEHERRIPHSDAGLRPAREDGERSTLPDTGLDTLIPRAGDEGYLELIAERFSEGHLTTAEALQLEQLHQRRQGTPAR